MKKKHWQFIKQGVAFLALLMMCVLIVNTMYINLIFSQKQIYRKNIIFQEYLEGHQNRHLTYAFFGDSSTDNSLDPSAVPGAYAFPLIGEKYPTTYFKLKKLYDQGVSISTVVLEVDLHSLTAWPKDEAVTRSQLYFYADGNDYKDLKEITGDSRLKYLILSQLVFIGQGDDIRYLVQPPNLAEIKLGATRKEGDFSQNPQKNAAATFDVMFKGKEVYGEKTSEYFLKTIALAQEQGSKVVLVTYPQTPQFRSLAARHGLTVLGFQEKVKEIIPGTECEDYRWLDYSAFFLNDEVPEASFSDVHHLNPQGARRFSEALATELAEDECVQGEDF